MTIMVMVVAVLLHSWLHHCLPVVVPIVTDGEGGGHLHGCGWLLCLLFNSVFVVVGFMVVKNII
jgi:hypothetical protein